jgi:dCTP deaminase
MKDPWIGVPVGTIVDEDITKLANSGQLITAEFDANFVKQACYELRASNIFWEPASPNENKKVDVSSDGFYLLKPNCYVVCIVAERIALPPNVMARILTKGRLFSLGVLPVNTYADPGFEGRLGITLFNGSKRYIKIEPGEPIAKIEFVLLPKPVTHAYNGQHGYETEIWPIPAQLLADVSEDDVAKQILDNKSEIELSFGPRIGRLARQVELYSMKVWLQIFLILAGFLVLFALYGQINLVQSMLVGIASNLLTTLGLNLWNVWKA